MRKKAAMSSVVPVLVFALILCFLLYITIHDYNSQKSKNLACQNLGFKELHYSDDFDLCKDLEGNLHYVEFFDCGFWGNHCLAKKITVGEVEVKP